MAVDLWTEMFSDEQTADVVRAVKELISELEFPPTIADVKKKIKVYVDERKWQQFVRDKEMAEQEERAKILAASETPKLQQPKLSKEEYAEYLAKCRDTLAKGEKND